MYVLFFIALLAQRGTADSCCHAPASAFTCPTNTRKLRRDGEVQASSCLPPFGAGDRSSTTRAKTHCYVVGKRADLMLRRI